MEHCFQCGKVIAASSIVRDFCLASNFVFNFKQNTVELDTRWILCMKWTWKSNLSEKSQRTGAAKVRRATTADTEPCEQSNLSVDHASTAGFAKAKGTWCISKPGISSPRNCHWKVLPRRVPTLHHLVHSISLSLSWREWHFLLFSSTGWYLSSLLNSAAGY